jgi:hypothetical protein
MATHPLETADGEMSQNTERRRPSDEYSRARDLSGHGKKSAVSRELTNSEAEREGAIGTWKNATEHLN